MIKNRLMKLIGIDVKASKEITPAIQRNLDEVARMSQSKEWKDHVHRLHNDPKYLAKELEKLDDEYNENYSQ